MSPIESFIKDPDAVLDYSINWDAWLGDQSISVATWAIDDGPDSDLVIDSSSIVGGVPTVWLSGGTVGGTYRVRCRVTTNEARTDDRSIAVKVRER